MNKKFIILFLLFSLSLLGFSFRNTLQNEQYVSQYWNSQKELKASLQHFYSQIGQCNLNDTIQKDALKIVLLDCRKALKKTDFWNRYFEPVAYKQINGPLPVEWETEVFEKYEAPYKRLGAGLTLASIYLDEDVVKNDSLAKLIQLAIVACQPYQADSITNQLNTFDHFYYCNRLFLLNLAAIYTTGFECPNTDFVIKEMNEMILAVADIYQAYNNSFVAQPLNKEYLQLFQQSLQFVAQQNHQFEQFDHYNFIRNYINPLYRINQQLIKQYQAKSKSTMDFSLNKFANSIFDKTLYNGQNSKGVFYNIQDKKLLSEIDKLGKLLFYDPILSANNQRSCASCHNPKNYFIDTFSATSLAFDHQNFLPRNTPSLINAPFNHLIMHDGRHISLQDQSKDVITNANEMASDENEVLVKVLSCKDYRQGFEKLLPYCGGDNAVSMDHISSALTYYYSKFSAATAEIDLAMNKQADLSLDAQKGFNLFMSKAQCATCHFVPMYNGVKPPYVGSEFEVLGTPATIDFANLSMDKGRYLVNPAQETLNAFRTGTLRNIMHTAPYMHNGVFKTIDEVLDFYDAGGGAGRGLNVPNQTLSSDSLRLTTAEKLQLKAFLNTLDEHIIFEDAPKNLPQSNRPELNKRKVAGVY